MFQADDLFRPRHARAVVGWWVAGTLVVAAAIWSSDRRFDRVLWTIAPALTFVPYLVVWSRRFVRLDPDGIVYRNLRRIERVPYDGIVGVAPGPGGVVLHRADDRPVVLRALIRSTGAFARGRRTPADELAKRIALEVERRRPRYHDRTVRPPLLMPPEIEEAERATARRSLRTLRWSVLVAAAIVTVGVVAALGETDDDAFERPNRAIVAIDLPPSWLDLDLRLCVQFQHVECVPISEADRNTVSIATQLDEQLRFTVLMYERDRDALAGAFGRLGSVEARDRAAHLPDEPGRTVVIRAQVVTDRPGGDQVELLDVFLGPA